MSEWWDLEWNSSNLSRWVPLHLNSCFTFLDTVNTVPTEPPTKPPSTCPDLTVPTNGMISYNMARLVDTMATYTCVNGYTLIGGSTRTCGSFGGWSGSAPTCSECYAYGELFWNINISVSCLLWLPSPCLQWNNYQLYWYNIRTDDHLLLQHWVPKVRISHDNLSY